MVWDLDTQLPFPPIKKYQTIPSLPTESFFQMFSKLHLYGERGVLALLVIHSAGGQDGLGITTVFPFCSSWGIKTQRTAWPMMRSIYFPRQVILSWTLPSTLAWFVPTFVKIMCKWVIPPSIWLSTQHSPFLTRSGERNLARPFHSHAWVSCCWNLYARTNPLPSLKLMMQVDTGHRIQETNALQ